jgi:hypothetical protein
METSIREAWNDNLARTSPGECAAFTWERSPAGAAGLAAGIVRVPIAWGPTDQGPAVLAGACATADPARRTTHVDVNSEGSSISACSGAADKTTFATEVELVYL